jgi:hypothetical protein
MDGLRQELKPRVSEASSANGTNQIARTDAFFEQAPVLLPRPPRAAGLWALELVHAVAIFAWANRRMLNLGEAVVPA